MEHHVVMKQLLKIMVLAAVLTLTGCMKDPEKMLIGRWQLDCVIELVVEVGGERVSLDTLPGYDSQTIEFLDDATCVLTDRGETTVYQWSLSGDNTLALFREGWAEDYTLNVLTQQRLVYTDTYLYTDTVTHKQYKDKYRFEYKRL